MDLEMASPEEIIANVERMIKQEETKNTAIKKDKRSAEKALDLDVGLHPYLQMVQELRRVGLQARLLILALLVVAQPPRALKLKITFSQR